MLDLANAPPADCPIGQVSAASGRASVEYVFAACDLALQHEVDAIVTSPINKAAMNLGGHAYAGHTELLAERTKAGKVSMLLVGPKLRVVHVSTHVALEDAIGRVTRQRVTEVIDLAAEACRALGIDAPRIAVAGLNPHAGEGGLFGDQEAREIVPAIEEARARGLDVSDPQPPDTVFLRAVRGAYDIVVAMYHDQGHIPMKLLAFDEGVNVSLGLPIIRTSVDHGTAFDIAGTGHGARREPGRGDRRRAADGAGARGHARRIVTARLAILADDLTGAADTGAPFAAAGRPTVVLLSPDAPAPLPPADVVVLTSESRALTPDRGRRGHAALCDAHRRVVPG